MQIRVIHHSEQYFYLCTLTIKTLCFYKIIEQNALSAVCLPEGQRIINRTSAYRLLASDMRNVYRKFEISSFKWTNSNRKTNTQIVIHMNGAFLSIGPLLRRWDSVVCLIFAADADSEKHHFIKVNNNNKLAIFIYNHYFCKCFSSFVYI